ncbi:hypothetical protein [Streptomyces sp. NPDC004285]
MYIYDTGSCSCECFGPISTSSEDPPEPGKKNGPDPYKLGREVRVRINVRKASMVDLAPRLAQWCDFELLVPTRRFADEVTVTLTDVELGSAVEQLGMLIADQ